MKKLLLLLLITSPLFAQQRVGQIDQDSTATRLARGWAVLSNINGALWMTYRDANNTVTKAGRLATLLTRRSTALQ